MLAKLRPHLTYANVMVTILTFLVLSTGGAYAAHETIFSNDIADGEVKNSDIQPNASDSEASVLSAAAKCAIT